jgi:hypothetical protein
VFDKAPKGLLKITLRGRVLAVADGKELARREVLVSSPELDVRHVKQGNVLLLNCKARLIAELQGN